MQELINNKYNSFELFREDYGNLFEYRINRMFGDIIIYKMFGNKSCTKQLEYYIEMMRIAYTRSKNFELIIRQTYEAYLYAEATDSEGYFYEASNDYYFPHKLGEYDNTPCEQNIRDNEQYDKVIVQRTRLNQELHDMQTINHIKFLFI